MKLVLRYSIFRASSDLWSDRREFAAKLWATFHLGATGQDGLGFLLSCAYVSTIVGVSFV